MSGRASDFEERPNRYPILKERILSLLDIAEDSSGNYEKADEAEQGLIGELRLTGNALMCGWASGKESVSTEESRKSDISVIGHGEKKLFRQTTFGETVIYGRLFLKEGIPVRPFSESSDVKCRGYSRPLQRRITDSGADVSFNRVPEKLMSITG